jgi:hypothetical protein
VPEQLLANPKEHYLGAIMAVFVDGNTLAGVTGVGNQNQSSVAALTSDVVVVTWAHASGAPAQPTVIKGQLFSASSGASLSAEFLVSLPDPDNQTSPSVAPPVGRKLRGDLDGCNGRRRSVEDYGPDIRS